jgi:hypothetical protein
LKLQGKIALATDSESAYKESSGNKERPMETILTFVMTAVFMPGINTVILFSGLAALGVLAAVAEKRAGR